MEVPEKGGSELQVARTPNLDALAAGGVCGLFDPVAPGITPERPWPFRDLRLSPYCPQHRPRYPVGVWHRFPTHTA